MRLIIRITTPETRSDLDSALPMPAAAVVLSTYSNSFTTVIRAAAGRTRRRGWCCQSDHVLQVPGSASAPLDLREPGMPAGNAPRTSTFCTL